MSNTFKDGIRRRSARLERALARLDALVDWEKRARSGPKERMRVSLEPAADLVARLGSPHAAFTSVHVAGSKGKGTTAALVESALRATGLRTALYTSPHVEHVEERLRLGGGEVEGERLAAALERALAAREAAVAAGSAARDATWFDVLTAAAFLVCAEEGTEVAVVECGLGGRLDSTNVVHGTVAAITNVYLEHTAILGSTRAAIAAEKAGIVKPGATVVVGALAPDDEAAAVVERVAAERGARCVRVEHAPETSLDARNRALAGTVLAELARAAPGLLARGRAPALDAAVVAAARLPGRAEHRRVGETRVVLDGAHVAASLELLLRDLETVPQLAARPQVVVGMGQEKDAVGLLKALTGRADRVHCSSVGTGPARDAAELAVIGRELGLDAHEVREPRRALEEAVRRAGIRSWVLVTGSLHLVGALRRHTRPW